MPFGCGPGHKPLLNEDMKKKQNTITPIIRRTRLDVVQQQINAIQSVALPIGSWLLGAYANNNPSDPDAFKRNPIKDEDIISAETTFILANEKLQEILKDPKLLDTEEHKTMETTTIAVLEENKKLIEAQERAVEWSMTPAARFEPLLVRLNAISGWAAVFGDLNAPNSLICGVGGTPEAALKHFNEVFTGQCPEPILLYALAREEALKLNRNNAPPPTFNSQPPEDSKI